MPDDKKLTDVVRVFVGTSAGDDAEACAVLEYGLRSRTQADLDITWMALSRSSSSPFYSNSGSAGWDTRHWMTPWTALRWAVPDLCGHAGRAVYFDCSTLVLGDVAALAAHPFPAGAVVLARRDGSTVNTGCLVWDCAAARRWLPPVAALQRDAWAHQTVGAMLSNKRSLVGDLPAGWGLRDTDYSRSPAVAASVHCVAPGLHPHAHLALRRLRARGREHWFSGARLPHFSQPLTKLFNDEYAAATAAGFTPDRYVVDEPEGGGKSS